MLRMPTAVPGHPATMRRVASMPFMFGIAISMMTTSGACSSARRTLSRPSAASATIAISVCFSSRARRPSRTTVWSSASSMRMGILLVACRFGERELGENHGSPPRMGFDGEASAETPHTLLHAEQAEAANGAGVEAIAVVANAEADVAVLAPEHHLDIVRVCVPGGVVNGFLDEAVDAGLVLVGDVVGI